MFLIVDFLNVAYRSFHAIRNLSNSKGAPTNAIYGFVQAVRRWNQEFSPTHLAIVMDGETPARRLAILPQYKAQRAPMPDPLKEQLGKMTLLFPQLGWPVVLDPLDEADDVGASLAVAAAAAGHEVRIASNDKDFLQITGPKIKVLRSSPKETVCADAEWVRQRWGIEVAQLVDFFSLMGDDVDNIPGVSGVGEKTAADLLQKFGSLEGILSSLDQIEKPKLREALGRQKADLLRNRVLIRLSTDLKIPPVDDFRIKEPQYSALLTSLAELEFKSLHEHYRKASETKLSPTQGMLF